MLEFKGEMTILNEFCGDMDINGNFIGEMGIIEIYHDSGKEHYQGGYIVNPRRAEQYLETDDKIMDDDVTVHSIFDNRVDNVAGGLTCTIGLP